MPFNLCHSSAPVDTITTHHIKSMGGSQWTGELYRLASDLAQDPTGLKRIKVGKIAEALCHLFYAWVSIEERLYS